MRFFDNVAGAIKTGEVTYKDICDWAVSVNPLTAEEKSNACWMDGKINQFQTVVLHNQARDLEAAKPEPSLDDLVVPAELLRDVPEAVYDEPLPDIAGEIKKRLGIIACVRKFGKPQDAIRDRSVEGVKVRCPHNDHTDHNPSAWVNTEKNVWRCGKCMTGGDQIDFYAARKGLNLKTYHTDGSFSSLVKEMGAQLGLSVKRRGSSYELVDDADEWPDPLPDRADEPEPTRPVATEAEDGVELAYAEPEPVVAPSTEASEPVTVSLSAMMAGISFEPDDFDLTDEIELDAPELNWRLLPINPKTFLGTFMNFGEEYFAWVPREYFLFAGLQAVGMAAGHHTQSFTGARLTGALMCLTVGSSGSGKSTAVRQLTKMFNRIPIVKFNPNIGSGIKVIPSPGSAEALIKSIYTEVDDTSTDTPGSKHEVGVTAWLMEDEFATIISKSKRNGSSFKTRLIGLYDFIKSDPYRPEMVLEEYSMSGGMRVLHDSYFSASFTTQTDSLRVMMEQSDLVSGFLNRIIPVLGKQRVRRRISDMIEPPEHPEHDEHYERLWRWCRADWKIIPFTEEAKQVFDEHVFIRHVENLADTDSLYSRVAHMTLRLAFLLALNNHESEVTPNYVEAACQIGSTYLMACFKVLRGAVTATAEDEGANRIVDYVERFYKRRGRWPTKREWTKDRSYTDLTGIQRERALMMLFKESRMVEITLTSEKKKETVYLVPNGPWASYEHSHEKTYAKAEFYA